MDEKQHQPAPRGVPAWLKRWGGFHSSGPAPAYALYVWPFIGSFCALAVLQAVFGHSWYFIIRGAPVLVTSYVSLMLVRMRNCTSKYVSSGRESLVLTMIMTMTTAAGSICRALL